MRHRTWSERGLTHNEQWSSVESKVKCGSSFSMRAAIRNSRTQTTPTCTQSETAGTSTRPASLEGWCKCFAFVYQTGTPWEEECTGHGKVAQLVEGRDSNCQIEEQLSSTRQTGKKVCIEDQSDDSCQRRVYNCRQQHEICD
jgi:hypothetical protein